MKAVLVPNGWKSGFEFEPRFFVNPTHNTLLYRGVNFPAAPAGCLKEKRSTDKPVVMYALQNVISTPMSSLS
jgi:hypothetical protein